METETIKNASPTKMTRNKPLFIFFLFFSFLFSMGLFIFRDVFKDAASLGLLGIFIINFIASASFFASGPAFLTIIAGGSLYPPLFVALASSLGSAAGDLISYVFGLSGRNITIERLKKKLWFTILEGLFKKYGILFIFLFALLPNPFFDAIGLFAGALGFPLRKFFIFIFAGRFIRFVLLALIGARYY